MLYSESFLIGKGGKSSSLRTCERLCTLARQEMLEVPLVECDRQASPLERPWHSAPHLRLPKKLTPRHMLNADRLSKMRGDRRAHSTTIQPSVRASATVPNL